MVPAITKILVKTQMWLNLEVLSNSSSTSSSSNVSVMLYGAVAARQCASVGTPTCRFSHKRENLIGSASVSSV